MKKNWFEIDREGLSKITLSRPLGRILAELVQNAWDADGVSTVAVEICPVSGEAAATVSVEDDSPSGFMDLSHAYTLFAESSKKKDATKRGRYNLGEKLVLSICREAVVSSTTGRVIFSKTGRRVERGAGRARGTRFEATLRATRAEVQEAEAFLSTLIPPKGIRTTLCGVEIKAPPEAGLFEETLPTEIAAEDGTSRPTRRKCEVILHEVKMMGERGLEVAMLYEMGIPVVEIGGRWHVNVMQKVPLNLDRDNVPPSYRKLLRVLVFNHMHKKLSKEDFADGEWSEAAADPRVTDEAFKESFRARFGESVVSRDVTDHEANSTAFSQGYNVLSGGALPKTAWGRARELGLVRPAGQLFPTRALSGETYCLVPEGEWTTEMKAMIRHASLLGKKLLGKEVRVVVADDIGGNTSATFGGGTLTYSLRALGKSFFARAYSETAEDGLSPIFHELLLHEFAHHYEMDHLSHRYHAACCRLGVRLARLCLNGELPILEGSARGNR